MSDSEKAWSCPHCTSTKAPEGVGNRRFRCRLCGNIWTTTRICEECDQPKWWDDTIHKWTCPECAKCELHRENVMNRQIDILDEVARERLAQDEKWGVQDREDLKWLAILVEEVGEVADELNSQWAPPSIGPKRLREELVQVAAVAVAWVEAIDRRQGDGA